MGPCGDIAKYTLLCSRLREAFDGYAAWRPDVARRPSSARSALESEITAVTRGRSLCIAAKTLYPKEAAHVLQPSNCAPSRRRAFCCQPSCPKWAPRVLQPSSCTLSGGPRISYSKSCTQNWLRERYRPEARTKVGGAFFPAKVVPTAGNAWFTNTKWHLTIRGCVHCNREVVTKVGPARCTAKNLSSKWASRVPLSSTYTRRRRRVGLRARKLQPKGTQCRLQPRRCTNSGRCIFHSPDDVHKVGVGLSRTAKLYPKWALCLMQPR